MCYDNTIDPNIIKKVKTPYAISESMSCVKIKRNRGPNTVHWETPLITDCRELQQPEICPTENDLTRRKDEMLSSTDFTIHQAQHTIHQ